MAFPTVGDPNKEIGRSYGVSRLGGLLCTRRVTFVIDKQGIIRRVIPEFDMNHHINAARQTLRELG